VRQAIKIRWSHGLTGLAALFYATTGLAALTPFQNAQKIVDNILHVASIIQIFCIIAGLGMFIGSIFQFKRYGEMRTFMSHQTSIARPLALMIASLMLLMMPMMLGTFLLAFFGDPNPMAYQNTSHAGWGAYLPVIIILIQVIGVTSFVRGIFLISRSGSQGQQGGGGLSKAIIHLFAGVLAVNVVGTVSLFRSIFGL
jgi:intracellular multiplication protein IcmC